MPQRQRLIIRSIDEVSSVDRGASADALISIAKRDSGEDEGMQFYDAEGQPIAEEELVSETPVYDENGDPIVDHLGRPQKWYSLEDVENGNVPDEVLQELIDSGEFEIPDDLSELDDYELEPVGKAAGAAVTGGLRTLTQVGRGVKDKALGQAATGRSAYRGVRGRADSNRGGGAWRAGNTARNNRGRIGVVAGGAGGGGAGMVSSRRGGNVSKSAGEQLLETLSKAYTDADRDAIYADEIQNISKRADNAEARAIRAERVSKSLEDQAILRGYVELADEYGLPVDSEEFGDILATIAESGLSKRQLDTLDRIFSAAADGGVLDELGASGIGSGSGVMDEVMGAVNDRVSKSAAQGVTVEQAVVEVFSKNDAAYVEYLREQGQL